MDGLPAPVAGRFAPSPSGPLHVGNLRTALLAWLCARSRGVPFYVRVEDLDRQRSHPEHVDGQLADLRRLQVDWDGDVLRQSQRAEAYRAAVTELRERGLLYPCWCTRAEIRHAASAPHGAGPEGAYPGTCRRLSPTERLERARAGMPAAWRVDAGGRLVAFIDRLHGRVELPVDDFVIWRDGPREASAGTAAYNLAVVVDDADQGVGEIVRGDDLLGTTPRQVLVAELLGLRVPRYAHVALVLGPDGSRLAKRHGAVTLGGRLHQGESVSDVVGWMAWTAGLIERPAPCRPSDLLSDFDPARLRRAPTVWPTVAAAAFSRGPERP